MSEAPLFQDLIDELAASGRLTAEDVLGLRKRIFPDGVVTREEAEAVFHLDHACKVKDADWTRFYVDALTDYFLWQSDPRGYVSAEQARELTDNVTADGRIAATSELELLLNIIHWATSCPEDLALLAMEAVRCSVLDPTQAVYGSNRPPEVVGAGDVEVLRKVIYGHGSEGGFTVTRREAELLWDLKDATAAEENAESWGDLFVKAVASHLLFPRGVPKVPDAQTVKAREAWLEERRGIGEMLRDMGRPVRRLDIPLGEAWRTLDLFGKEAAREKEARERAWLEEAMVREVIDAEEANWLVARLEHDSALDDQERALLAFIAENAQAIDPALQAVIDRSRNG
jgi:hypothetical protein